MELRKVTAIIRGSALKRVEQHLKEIRVPGISVSKVKGYGEYANFFTQDWLSQHARIEIFTTDEKAHEIADAILDSARSGCEGDGIVVVLPVLAVYRIRSGEAATSDELGGFEGMAGGAGPLHDEAAARPQRPGE